MDIFKKIEINIPFAEVISQMPLYAKFLKEILSKKRKIAEESIVNLTATCSAIIQQKLPAKMKYPGSFTIPCSIGKFEFKKALCDSGASINLMPKSVVQRLSLGELTPTAITLQCNLQELMFHNSCIFNVPFKDNCSVLICYFCISVFNSFVINSFFLDSITLSFQS